MDWLARVCAELAGRSVWGYSRGDRSASEPAALVGMALTASGDFQGARASLDWLRSIQARDGSIGVSASQREPGWPTAWALAAWIAFDAATTGSTYRVPAQKGVAWLLSIKGETLPASPEFGHDVSLVGWPWVEHTHSWLEPTALAVMALRYAEHGGHPRVKEGIRLLIDRLLDEGGCNYGNTVVDGQALRAHVQPTGLCLLALAGEHEGSGKLRRSIDWLGRSVGPATTPVSLAYALAGLSAHGQFLPQAEQWLRAQALRELTREARAYPLALIAWAAYRCRRDATSPALSSTIASMTSLTSDAHG